MLGRGCLIKRLCSACSKRQLGVPRSLHVKLRNGLAAPQTSRRRHKQPDQPHFHRSRERRTPTQQHLRQPTRAAWGTEEKPAAPVGVGWRDGERSSGRAKASVVPARCRAISQTRVAVAALLFLAVAVSGAIALADNVGKHRAAGPSRPVPGVTSRRPSSQRQATRGATSVSLAGVELLASDGVDAVRAAAHDATVTLAARERRERDRQLARQRAARVVAAAAAAREAAAKTAEAQAQASSSTTVSTTSSYVPASSATESTDSSGSTSSASVAGSGTSRSASGSDGGSSGSGAGSTSTVKTGPPPCYPGQPGCL